jgi:hypothetical protein
MKIITFRLVNIQMDNIITTKIHTTRIEKRLRIDNLSFSRSVPAKLLVTILESFIEQNCVFINQRENKRLICFDGG